MPKMKPGTLRVAIAMPAGSDMTVARATASDAADKHSKNVEVKDLTFRTWFKAGAAEEGLSMGVPAAKTRWTKDGNLSVEVC